MPTKTIALTLKQYMVFRNSLSNYGTLEQWYVSPMSRKTALILSRGLRPKAVNHLELGELAQVFERSNFEFLVKHACDYLASQAIGSVSAV